MRNSDGKIGEMRRSIVLSIFLCVPVVLIVLHSFLWERAPRLLMSAWALQLVFVVVLVVQQISRDDRRRLLRHRADFGLCLECGYDLRGSQGTCPECGAAIPSITKVD